ncbi:MAG TPA: thiamine pyrophosphate-dependent enzyme [Pseudonocardiaceae bacterium]|nr:thiamine pyrophosphate-dependent enzyme [Pseudonocardiaceae bacterium]
MGNLLSSGGRPRGRLTRPTNDVAPIRHASRDFFGACSGAEWLRTDFGRIGQGLTTAIGALVAADDQPAFLVEGDAGFMMHLPEFETAVRYGLPILVVLFNDQLLGAEYHKAVAKGLNADPAPTIVDARIFTSVISIPYRRLHFGQDA